MYPLFAGWVIKPLGYPLINHRLGDAPRPSDLDSAKLVSGYEFIQSGTPDSEASGSFVYG